MNDDVKLTPEDWSLRTGIHVMDPDGWNRRDFEVSWARPITRDEFLVRANSSTCMKWPKPLYDEKWHDQPDKEKEVETMSNPATPNPNPLLDIINEMLKPKTSPTVDTNELTKAATQLHAMFEVFVTAGFTEAQALELVGRVLKS